MKVKILKWIVKILDELAMPHNISLFYTLIKINELQAFHPFCHHVVIYIGFDLLTKISKLPMFFCLCAPEILFFRHHSFFYQLKDIHDHYLI